MFRYIWTYKLPFQCDFDPAEDNYEDFCNLESTRQALHVGSLEFPNSGDVYFSMINVFMDDGREDVEFCLENYRTLIYNGNFDIICDHTGIMDMILDLNWSGLENYKYLRWDTTQIWVASMCTQIVGWVDSKQKKL